MPEEMTLPRTRSAMKADCRTGRRDQHEAGQGRQLELDQGDEELDARMKKASSTSAQAKNRQAIWMKFSKNDQ